MTNPSTAIIPQLTSPNPGTTQFLVQDSSVEMYITSEQANELLLQSIPQGPTGLQGVQGSMGVQGSHGTQGSLAVDYEKMCALAFAAIKELKQELDLLKGTK